MGSVSQSGTILINNLDPTVDAGPSQVVYQGSSVTFAGQASDPGPSTSDITAIEWDFDYQGTFTTDSSGSLTPSHTYSAPGAYLVGLRATDRNGGFREAFTSVEVRPTDGLVVNAGPDLTAHGGVPVAFAGSYSGGGTVSSSAIESGPTHHRFSKTPSPRRISSRKAGSSAAANRFLAMLSLAECTCKSDRVSRRSNARSSAAARLLTRL